MQSVDGNGVHPHGKGVVQVMIIGAGLSGLIAAHMIPNVPIIESEPEPRATRCTAIITSALLQS